MLPSCGCGTHPEDTDGTFKWSGCDDNVRWGAKFARQFVKNENPSAVVASGEYIGDGGGGDDDDDDDDGHRHRGGSNRDRPVRVDDDDDDYAGGARAAIDSKPSASASLFDSSPVYARVI